MKVLITREIPQVGINILQQYPQLKLDYKESGKPLTKTQLIDEVKDADAVIPSSTDLFDKELITAAKKLKVISTYSVGFDHIDLEHASKKGIYVGNTPGDLTEAVSEHIIALMLGVGRHIASSDSYCREGKFKYWEPMSFIGPKFMGKTLGLIGFGRIGQLTARIARWGFNMDIIYHDLTKHDEAENLLDAKKVDLDTLLENSDVISLSVNLTDATRHLIDKDELRKMKPYAILINTSRGPVINEKALATALKEEWIAGAGLDVFENEPKIESELLDLKNVVLTPHIASATWEARIQMARMAAENIIDVLVNNKPPRYLVNKDISEKTITSLV
jgi:glyoxylate reductase